MAFGSRISGDCMCSHAWTTADQGQPVLQPLVPSWCDSAVGPAQAKIAALQKVNPAFESVHTWSAWLHAVHCLYCPRTVAHYRPCVVGTFSCLPVSHCEPDLTCFCARNHRYFSSIADGLLPIWLSHRPTTGLSETISGESSHNS